MCQPWSVCMTVHVIVHMYSTVLLVTEYLVMVVTANEGSDSSVVIDTHRHHSTMEFFGICSKLIVSFAQ